MTPLDFKTQQVVNSIVDVIEMAYTQGRTVTFRTIFSFLQFPSEAWADDPEEGADQRSRALFTPNKDQSNDPAVLELIKQRSN